jgi:hypothetical protein
LGLASVCGIEVCILLRSALATAAIGVRAGTVIVLAAGTAVLLADELATGLSATFVGFALPRILFTASLATLFSSRP